MPTFKHKRGTAAQFATANPVLAAGEPALETDTVRFKYGDGVTAYNDLPYFINEDQVDAMIDASLSGVTVDDATESLAGVGEIATLAEMTTGTSHTNKFATPAGVRQERTALKTELLGGATSAWDTLQELKALVDSAEESSTISALTTTVGTNSSNITTLQSAVAVIEGLLLYKMTVAVWTGTGTPNRRIPVESGGIVFWVVIGGVEPSVVGSGTGGRRASSGPSDPGDIVSFAGS